MYFRSVLIFLVFLFRVGYRKEDCCLFCLFFLFYYFVCETDRSNWEYFLFNRKKTKTFLHTPSKEHSRVLVVMLLWYWKNYLLTLLKKKKRKHLFQSFIRPEFVYCCQLWYKKNTTKALMDVLFIKHRLPRSVIL